MSFDGNVFYEGGGKPKTGRGYMDKMLGDNLGDTKAKSYFISSSYPEVMGFVLPQTVAELRDSPLLAATVLQLTSTAKSMQVSREGSTLVLSLRIPEPYIAYAKKLDLDRIANRGSKDPGTEELIAAYSRVRRLDWDRQVELWLDLEKGCAIKGRKDFNPEGKLIQTIECEDFRYTHKGNLWLPWKCTVKSYVKNPHLLDVFTDDPERTDTIELQEVTFQPREDISFVLDYGPGTLVTDRSTEAAAAAPSGSVTYTVPAEKNELREAANAVRVTSPVKVIFISVNLIVAAGLIYLLLRRRFRR